MSLEVSLEVSSYMQCCYDSRSKGPKFELPGTHPPGTMAPKCRSAKEEEYRLADAEAAEQARKKAAFAAMVLKVDAKKAAFAANVESSSAFAAAKADEARALMVDAKKATFAKKAADEKAAFAAFKAAKAAAADEAPIIGTVSGTPTSSKFARCRSCYTVTRVDDCEICPLLRYLWVWGTGARGSINGTIYLYTCILKTNPKDKILKTNPKDKS